MQCVLDLIRWQYRICQEFCNHARICMPYIWQCHRTIPEFMASFNRNAAASQTRETAQSIFDIPKQHGIFPPENKLAFGLVEMGKNRYEKSSRNGALEQSGCCIN